MGSHRTHLAIFTLVAFLAAVLYFSLVPPIAQDEAYHQFADTRNRFGIPNFLNVLSNLAFLAVGITGWALNRQGKLVHDNAKKFPVYSIFFIGVALTGVGSAYYHWSPDNTTLVWDRLPMTLGFIAFTVAIFSEYVKPGIERRLLYPLLGLGLFSVVYLHLTELQGRGDLRLYALVQFLPLPVIPVIALLRRSRYTRPQDIYTVVVLYVLAKVAEHFDGALFSLTNIISGHTVKHLLAATGALWVLRMLWLRKENPCVLVKT